MTAEVEPIAVVGMACHLPGARDLDEFWANLVGGRSSITHFDEDQLRAAGVPEHDLVNPDYVRAAPIMPDAGDFDADLFGLSPGEAEVSDPQLRIFIELTHSAVENAGYDPFGLPDSVGLFATAGPPIYLFDNVMSRPNGGGMVAATLNYTDYFATRVSHRFGLRGPSMTVQTACSSSLVAVHLATESLRSGECDAALAGGAVVEIPLGWGYRWTPGGVFSKDGHCRPFDAAGTGTVFGSGAGIVMLKRLDDALADGDRIRAVIRGSAINNDGADKVSYSAPSVSGQAAAIGEAMALARTHPGDIGHVEAHATGTVLGDPVEVAALTEAYGMLSGEPVPPGRIPIGSVKSNIGHLANAAGIASLIKTVLMLERETIVPTIGIRDVNPRLELEKSPFRIAGDVTPWPRDTERPRVAAVSSLGIGGTNAHLIVQEAPAAAGRTTPAVPRVIVWSAQDETAAAQLGDDLGAYFGGRSAPAEFADSAATLQHGRHHHPVRSALVADSAADAAAALIGDRSRIVSGRVRLGTGTALLLPGNGSERAAMATGLYGTVRAFTMAMDECLELFENRGAALYDVWTSGRELPPDPVVVQPLLFAVEYSLSSMWSEWGLRPGVLLGHSLGEIAAAAVTGVLDLSDATAVVHARATAMKEHPADGGMLAVAAASDAVTKVLDDDVVIAAVNGPRQTVLSGPTAALRAAAEDLTAQGHQVRELPVAYAFHHPGWAAAVEQWRRVFDGVTLQPPRIPLLSARTGELVTPAQAVEPSFWTDQLLHPVMFWPAVETLLADGPRLLVECGPGHTLTGIARDHPSVRAGDTVTVVMPEDSPAGALRAAAELWTRGIAIDWSAAGQPAPVRRVPLPGYPYQRKRYWADAVDTPAAVVASPVSVVAPPAEEPPPEPAKPFSQIQWVTAERRPGPDLAGRTALVMLPADDEQAMTVVLAVQRAGLRVIRMRTGPAYAEGPAGFVVPADDLAAAGRVFTALHDRDRFPDVLIHAAATGPAPAALADRIDQAFTGLLTLSRAALNHPPGRVPPRLTVLTREAVDVSGGDPVTPARATAAGLVRTLGGEAPALAARLIDIGRRVPVTDLAGELAADPDDEVVALRGRSRWTPIETSFVPAGPVGQPLRENGVYLITGGFGGLGQALVRGLAGTGLRPHLLLVGRHDPELAAPEDGKAATARDAISEARDLGAHVHPIIADVADRAALAAAIDPVTAVHGPVNGLFHLAGVPGNRMVAFREPADAAAVLHPKTTGTATLTDLFTGRPRLDFAVFYSSRAATEGLIGGADYAAANAYLDAAAAVSPLAAGRTLSVGWPLWRGAGMVAPDAPDITRLGETMARLTAAADPAPAAPAGPAGPEEVAFSGDYAAATHWVLDEHRLDRKPLLVGTVYLDLVARVAAERAGNPAAPVELTDVVFRVPFYDHRPRTLRMTVRAVGSGHDFRVSSRPADEPGTAWLDHATGHVEILPERAADPVDVAAVRARVAEPEPAAGHPFMLGPRWDVVDEVRSTDGEKLVRLNLSPAFAGDLAEHRLHPALLDVATAAVRTSEQTSFVPFVYRRLVLRHDLPARFYAHARRRAAGEDTATGDVCLFGEDGRVLVTVEGFTMRHNSLGADWDQPAADPTPENAPGMEPEVGVELLLRMLATRTPPSVLVRPYQDGKPLPLGPGAVRPAAPLPAPSPAPVPVPEAPVAPTAPGPGGDTGDQLRRLWEQALGAPPAGDDEDFFDAGGNSLSAVDLMARIRVVFGQQLSIGLLLERRTFAALAETLAPPNG